MSAKEKVLICLLFGFLIFSSRGSYLFAKTGNISRESLMDEFYKSGIKSVEKDFVDVYFKEAKRYYNQGSYSEAIGALLKSLSLCPDDRRCLLLLAKTFLSVQDYDRAMDTLKKAMRYYPKDLEVLKMLAKLYDIQGKERALYGVLVKMFLISPESLSQGFYGRFLDLLKKYEDKKETQEVIRKLVNYSYSSVIEACKDFIEGEEEDIDMILDEVKRMEMVLRYFGDRYLLGARDFISGVKSTLYLVSMGYVEIGKEKLRVLLDEQEDDGQKEDLFTN